MAEYSMSPSQLAEGAYRIRSCRAGHFMLLRTQSGFKGWLGFATGSQVTFAQDMCTTFRIEKVDIETRLPALLHDASFMAGRSATGRPQPLYTIALAHEVRETFINWDTNRFETSQKAGPWELFELHSTLASPNSFFIYSPSYRCYLSYDASTLHPNKVKMVKSQDLAFQDGWEFVEAT